MDPKSPKGKLLSQNPTLFLRKENKRRGMRGRPGRKKKIVKSESEEEKEEESTPPSRGRPRKKRAEKTKRKHQIESDEEEGEEEEEEYSESDDSKPRQTLKKVSEIAFWLTH
jgi:hypothetical protein